MLREPTQRSDNGHNTVYRDISGQAAFLKCKDAVRHYAAVDSILCPR